MADYRGVHVIDVPAQGGVAELHAKQPYVICDLDGTMCDCAHRHQYARARDWEAFHARLLDDPPVRAVLTMVRLLMANNVPIVYMTGRPERYRPETIHWLSDQYLWSPTVPIYMRPNEDFRSDVVAKFDLFTRCQAEHPTWYPLVVFEDRDRVVQMWRGLGIPCFQVAEGTY